MIRRGQFLTAVSAAIGLVILIFDSQTALAGAQSGVMLCIQTVIPALFPFFFLSSILSGALTGRQIKLLRPIGRLLRIPAGAEYILIAGFLGGYPVGAHCICDALKADSLSRGDARRMISFCNNCGPAFVFGMASVLFQQRWIPWALFVIHIVSALTVAMCIPGKPDVCTPPVRHRVSLIDAFQRSLHSIAAVCGWVVLFRVVIAFAQRWVLWYFMPEIKVAISGILELSNGCINLAAIESTTLRFILCSGFLGFGGLCVTIQTVFAAQNVDKSLYFPGKVLQSLISITLACMVTGSALCIIPSAVSIILILFLRKMQKRCRNPQTVGV